MGPRDWEAQSNLLAFLLAGDSIEPMIEGVAAPADSNFIVLVNAERDWRKFRLPELHMPKFEWIIDTQVREIPVTGRRPIMGTEAIDLAPHTIVVSESKRTEWIPKNTFAQPPVSIDRYDCMKIHRSLAVVSWFVSVLFASQNVLICLNSFPPSSPQISAIRSSGGVVGAEGSAPVGDFVSDRNRLCKRRCFSARVPRFGASHCPPIKPHWLPTRRPA